MDVIDIKRQEWDSYGDVRQTAIMTQFQIIQESDDYCI